MMFAEKGLRVLRNGYQVIPIKPGQKAPAIDNFLHINADAAQVKRWQANGFSGHGVGIVTGHVVMVDLDIPNAIVKKIHLWCIQHLGFGVVRVGQAPKIGLIFRTDHPFPTRMSRTYRDKQGRRCRIEILSIGRQFVAFHIHPDTGLPYLYPDGDSPENTPVDALQVVTWEEIEPLFAYFDQVAEEEGWTRVGNEIATRSGGRNELLNPKQPPVGFDEDKIRETVMGIPNDSRFDARDDWLQVGFALHHETAGSELGRELWYEWSSQHPTHDDALCEKAWNSFGTHGADPNYADITFRYIIKVRGVFRTEELKQQLEGFHLEIDLAKAFEDLRKVATAASGVRDIDKLDREQLASAVQQKAKRLGVTLPIRLAREMVRYHETEIEVPKWLEGWVFLTHTGQFYNRSTGAYVDRGAFDAAFDRYVPPDITPTHYATRIAQVPVYHMTMYLPGEDAVFRDTAGLEWINTYRDTSPPMPMEYTPQDLRNIEIVKGHAVHLFGEEAERDIAILHSTLAYVVQTGKRVNWMTILQGAEGIGKTFYSEMMAAVLGGPPHVYKLDTETLTGSAFTEWAEGHQVVFIEELKVHGKRYDVMNKLKTYVTDAAVSIHPKGVRQYNAVNTTSYLAFTNHRDAVPLERGDTRYFVMLSLWQSEKEARSFKAANPRYYDRLFSVLQESPGAIRRWLMEYELHPDFNPVARAPVSSGKDQVIEESKSEIQDAIEDMIASREVVGVSEDLVIVHLLRDALSDDSGMVPTPESIRSVLQKLQFTPTRGGRVKITDTRRGVRQDFYCWSSNPQILAKDAMGIREIIMRDIIK